MSWRERLAAWLHQASDEVVDEEFKRGRPDKAIKWAGMAYEHARRTWGVDDGRTVDAACRLGRLLTDHGRPSEAVEMLEFTHAHWLLKFGPRTRGTVRVAMGLSECYEALGRLGEAWAVLIDPYEALRRADPEGFAMTSLIAQRIKLRRLLRADSDLTALENAVATWEARYGPDSPLTVAIVNTLADSYVDHHLSSRASPLYERCVRWYRNTGDDVRADSLAMMRDRTADTRRDDNGDTGSAGRQPARRPIREKTYRRRVVRRDPM